MDKNRLIWAKIIEVDSEDVVNDIDCFQAAMENCFKVIDKRGQLVPFKLKKAQRRFLEIYFKLKLAGMPIRIIVLKARQLGMSTLIAAIAMMEMMLSENLSCLVAADDKGDVTSALFEIYKRYVENYPIPDQIKSTTKGHRLILQNGSNIRCTGEKSVKGITCRYLHLSEAAFFSDLSKFNAMANQAIPSLPETVIILETTANRYGDSFYNFYKETERGENDYEPIFLPWFWDEDYQLPFADDLEKLAFEKSLNTIQKYGEERELLKTHGEITLEHMKWRRWCIANNCENSIGEFHRQYPSNAEEAFLAQDTNVIKTDALQHYLNFEVREPEEQGYFEIPDVLPHQKDPIFVKSEFDRDIVQIYEEPDPFADYVSGSDHAIELESKDYNHGVIVRRQPLGVVGVIRGFGNRRMGILEFSRQFFMLLKYYNMPYLAPESNAQGQALINLFQEWEYPNLMAEMELFVDTKLKDRWGWTNTQRTRSDGVALVKDHIENKIIRIPDKTIINQMMTFIWANENKGPTENVKAQAALKGKRRTSGDEDETGMHDDGIFALMGALFTHRVLDPPLGADEKRKQQGQTDRDMFDALMSEGGENDVVSDALENFEFDPLESATDW